MEIIVFKPAAVATILIVIAFLFGLWLGLGLRKEQKKYVNDERLNRLADSFCDKIEMEPTQMNESQTGMEYGYTYNHLIKCYKEGYHKAKEEQIWTSI